MGLGFVYFYRGSIFGVMLVCFRGVLLVLCYAVSPRHDGAVLMVLSCSAVFMCFCRVMLVSCSAVLTS